MSTRSAAIYGLAAGVLLAACGSGDGGESDASIVLSDVWLDAPPPRPADITVTITHPAPGTLDRTPLAGAAIAISQGGAIVAEGTTGVDGTFAATIDRAGGPASITAYSADHRARSVLGSDADAIAIFLPWRGGAPGRAVITGSVLNRDPTRRLTLTATAAPLFVWSNDSDTFSLALETEQPFAIVAYEWAPRPGAPALDVLRWAATPAPALGADGATQDIDLVAHEVTPSIVRARLVIPGGADSAFALGGYAAFHVRANAVSNAFVGTSTGCELAADGAAFECQASVIAFEHPSIAPVARYSIYSSEEESGVHVAGAPVDGATIDSFLAVPVLTSPGIHEADAWSGPFAFEVEPGADEVHVTLLASLSTPPTWELIAPADATSIELPPAPAAMAAELAASGDRFIVDFKLCDGPSSERDTCERYAYARRFVLARVPGVVTIRGEGHPEPAPGGG